MRQTLTRTLIEELFTSGHIIKLDSGEVLSPGGRILRSNIQPHGYLTVCFRGRNLKVHRLVAYAIWGDQIFEEKIMVRHLDGTRTNPAYTNLALGTAKDNSRDRPQRDRSEAMRYAVSFRKEPWNKILSRVMLERIAQECIWSPKGKVKNRGLLQAWADRLGVTRAAISLGIRRLKLNRTV